MAVDTFKKKGKTLSFWFFLIFIHYSCVDTPNSGFWRATLSGSCIDSLFSVGRKDPNGYLFFQINGSSLVSLYGKSPFYNSTCCMLDRYRIQFHKNEIMVKNEKATDPNILPLQIISKDSMVLFITKSCQVKMQRIEPLLSSEGFTIDSISAIVIIDLLDSLKWNISKDGKFSLSRSGIVDTLHLNGIVSRQTLEDLNTLAGILRSFRLDDLELPSLTSHPTEVYIEVWFLDQENINVYIGNIDDFSIPYSIRALSYFVLDCVFDLAGKCSPCTTN